jgi:hypothetical protein
MAGTLMARTVKSYGSIHKVLNWMCEAVIIYPRENAIRVYVFQNISSAFVSDSKARYKSRHPVHFLGSLICGTATIFSPICSPFPTGGIASSKYRDGLCFRRHAGHDGDGQKHADKHPAHGRALRFPSLHGMMSRRSPQFVA